MQKINIEDNFKYLMDRGEFEYTKAIQNVAFMADKHIKDVNDSYLKSDLHLRLTERAEETRLHHQLYARGTVAHIFEGRNIPDKYRFNEKNKILTYEAK